MPNTATLEQNRTDTKSTALLERFVGFWNMPVLEYLPVRALVALVILGACFVRAYIGLWGSRIYTQDAFAMLDGGWRVISGQRPHVDFYSGLGPVSYLMAAAGMVIANGNSAGLAYGQALFGCLAGLWCYLLCRWRVRDVAAILACVVVVLMAIVPTVMGDSPSSTNPGTTYNRYGYALVALLLIEGAAGCEPNGRKRETWGGISTGLVLGILLFLKISFFMAAAGLMIALAPLRKQSIDRWRGIAIAFGLSVLSFAGYLKFDLAAMYSDLRTVAHAKHVMFGLYLAQDVVVNAFPFLLFVYLITRDEPPEWSRRAIRMAGWAVCLAGFFLLMTSWQFFGLPLNSVMAVLLLDRAVGRRVGGTPAIHPRFAVLLFGALLILPYAGLEAAGLKFALMQKLNQVPHTSFTAAPLAGFNSTLEHDYVEYINEGCDLLSRHRQPGDSVIALNFTNPFSYAMGMKPSSGGATWMQYGTNFNESGPPAERIFGDATLVMLPKLFSDKTLTGTVPRIYGPYLSQHYTVAAESLNWWLYRRKGSG